MTQPIKELISLVLAEDALNQLLPLAPTQYSGQVWEQITTGVSDMTDKLKRLL